MEYRNFDIRGSQTRDAYGYTVHGPADENGHAPLLFRCGDLATARRKVDQILDSPKQERS